MIIQILDEEKEKTQVDFYLVIYWFYERHFSILCSTTSFPADYCTWLHTGSEQLLFSHCNKLYFWVINRSCAGLKTTIHWTRVNIYFYLVANFTRCGHWFVVPRQPIVLTLNDWINYSLIHSLSTGWPTLFGSPK